MGLVLNMKMYKELSDFPNDIIETGASIVIYGFGVAGKRYYNYVKNEGDYTIKYVVDRNYENMGEGEPPIYSPDVLLQDTSYNYVLIAIDSYKISSDVKDMLLSLGIEKEKIVTTEVRSCFSDVVSQQEIVDYVHESYKRKRVYARTGCVYLSKLANTLHKSAGLGLDFCKGVIKRIPVPEEKLLLLRMLFEIDMFDTECMRLYMDSIASMQWTDDTPYVLLYDTVQMAFMRTLYYDSFFNERETLLRKMSEYYSLQVEKYGKQEKNIAIIAEDYSEEGCANNNSIHRLIKQYARAFAQNGYKVMIVSLETRTAGDSNKVFLESVVGERRKKEDEVLVEEKGIYPNVYVYSNTDKSIRRRLKKNIEIISMFEPSVIFDWSQGYSVEIVKLCKIFQVLKAPVYGHDYGTFCNLFITRNLEKTESDFLKYGLDGMGKFIQLSLGNLPEERNTGLNYERKNMGFSEDDFLIVTVGNRLYYEVDDTLIKAICRILLKNRDLKWLLVGDIPVSDIQEYNDLIADRRVILWGYEKNLESLYRICNVYLQPNRTGGGVSIRQAMRQSLPVIMSDFPCDAFWQIERTHIVHGGYEDVADRIEHLARDKGMYMKCREDVRKRAELFSAENDAKQVLDVIANMRKQEALSANIK